jgi:hypothetical protein
VPAAALAKQPSANAVMKGTQAVPRNGGPMPLAAAVAPQGAPQAQARGSSLVTLQAPDGTQQQVPAQFAAHFESRGARRIG